MVVDPRPKKKALSCEEIYGPYPKVSVDSENILPEQDPVDSTLKADQQLNTAKIDPRDVGTPDEWISRDPQMIRLTGRHPFNSEPPLSILDEYQFITPVGYHVVRNHGAVPQLTWEDHTLVIGGDMVPYPMEFTMDELATMTPTRELPVTISCCGNRRKEVNMIKQTIGFSWGAAGVGTNVYKGVFVRDLLLRAGVSDEDVQDKHVEFVGYEDLPNKVGPGPFQEKWDQKVKYGTSIPLGRAMSPAFDVLIAYEANGEKLHPDHGFPVRVVIPGYIGGRMVKWLKEINVLSHESKNHYHYHDNKYLPPHVTAEESLQGGWWYKQEYIINELSLNSVITRPDHNTTIPLAKNLGDKMEVGGYAHTGGGRMVTRVEVSLDEGLSWHVAKIDRKERPNAYGMYWCWIFWAYEIEVSSLIGCNEIWCRAWDGANNPQSIEPTWTLMGQNANHVFRVKVHTDRSTNGECVFRFEHPTQPGLLPGGWATRVADKFQSAGYGRITYSDSK